MESTHRGVCVFAAASVSNVCCGFDALGFAIDGPGDEVEVRLSDRPGVCIAAIEGDDGRLSRDPDQNTAGVAASALLEAAGRDEGVEITIRKKMPIGSGLGSSAASAAAAVYALNELLETGYEVGALLPFAIEGERAACGSAHADNVAPALLGGFVLIRSYDPLDVVRLPYPAELCCTVLYPHLEVRTEDARRMLEENIPLQDAVTQWSNLGGLIAGLYTGDFDLIGRSLEDVIIEPVRSALIPGFQRLKATALEAGALGCSISGSGPSLFALSSSEETAAIVGEAMQEVANRLDLESTLYVSGIRQGGAAVLEQV